MDVTDLMIGDWIEDGYKKAQVTSITCDGIVETTAAISNIEVVDPIPLTEDILVRNGFIFNKGYAVLQVSEDTYLDFYKHEHRLRKVWEGIDEWNNHAKVRDVTFVCQCYYVHEFQHALRLCGVEKSIIL